MAWKQRTLTLPDDARAPGVYEKHHRAYPFCLPVEFASHNLLPEVRDGAIVLFKELDIPWHDSVAGGPSNHLRDSQVQCVNALFAMVADAERIKLAFGGAVDIAEVLPIEEGRFLTFEYIGPTDYFGEGVRRWQGRRTATGHQLHQRRRRLPLQDVSRCDRAGADRVEVHRVLPRRQGAQARLPTPSGSVGMRLTSPRATARSRLDVLPIELLLDEPFYQLMRQQLLAKRLEHDRVLDAEVVRVLHVLAPENTGYQDSLARAEHRALGSSVDEVWTQAPADARPVPPRRPRGVPRLVRHQRRVRRPLLPRGRQMPEVTVVLGDITR